MSYIKYLVFIIAFIGVSNAQNPGVFVHLTTENGLSQSDVNCIYQDNHGFMWFGTHDGLNRYDGYKFRVFKPDKNNSNSISSNLIWQIVGDSKGGLWIGTTGNGMSYFNQAKEKFTNYKHNESDANSLISNHISTIYTDSKDRLWIGTDKGVDMVDLKKPLDSIKFNHYEIYNNKTLLPQNNTVYSIYEDKYKQIWIGGAKGLSKLSRDKNGDLYFQSANQTLNLPKVRVVSICEDSYGNLIAGTTRGVFIIKSKSDTYKIQKIYGGIINQILTYKENIWLGTDDGLMQYENISNLNVPTLKHHYKYNPKDPKRGLSKNNIKSLFIDRTGIIWVGVNGGGVNKFDPDRKQFQHIRKTLDSNSLSNDKVRSIFEDSNGYLWIGTEGGGLNMLKKNLNGSIHEGFINLKKVLKPFVIREIKIDGKKKLLIGAENGPGLYELDITNPDQISDNSIKEVKEIGTSAFSILEDSNKNIWIGTYNRGVHRWLATDKSNEYKKDILSENENIPFSISNNIIRDIIEDSKGNIWFATGDGLSKLSLTEVRAKQPKFQVYKNIKNDTESISHDYILTVFESNSGDIWAGTLGGGLCKFIPSTDGKTDRFKTYSEKDGLPNNVIKAMLEDDEGNLWLSTNKGLSRFNISDETFKNFDVNDGLQGNEFSELASFKRSTGELLFGGVNGVTVFYPNSLKENIVNAETVLTSFSIFNKPISIGEKMNGRVVLDKSINDIDTVELKHRENSFSFEFAALHYAAPLKNKYAYKLEGFNEDWIHTSSENRFATYTNLQPGTYTLKVKASNNDGVWDDTPTELTIKVIPPFWRTTWAYMIYTLLALGCLLAFRRYTIISSTKKHQLELEHLEKEKNEELHRLKLEFFTNISHEFRTPLTLINGPLEYLKKNVGNITSKEANRQYVLMQKNTDYLLRLINQLLDFRKMDKGKMNLVLNKSDIVEFLKEVAEPFQFLSRKKMIDFKLKSTKESITTWFDADALEKIVNNLLSNAFKFTPEKGSITLQIFEGIDFKPSKTLKPEIDESNYLVIQVKDSGPGIPQHRIKHIFERFYTDIGRKELNAKGAGIGLSFTKNLVELHKGHIDVQSDSENGTTFLVWLPKDKKSYENNDQIDFHYTLDDNSLANQVDAESHAIGVLDDIVDKNVSRMRSKLPVLLIVDDNPDIRSFLKNSLGEKYYIYEAEDGKQGFDLSKKVMPNIIITDLMMPVMDGVELCNKLKTTQETSHIPIIMLTAKMSQEWEIQGLKTGADTYIRKPFSVELIELKIANILRHREELRRRFNREITLQPEEVTVTSSDEKFLQKAIGIVEKNMVNSEFSVELLVKEMSISRSNLYLKTKELTGLSSSEFIRNIRLKRAVQLLEKSDLSVKEIMYMTGFSTASYFSKCFKKQFGVIPSKYIKSTNLINADND
ncbi:hybrid sensor histidine kinase/response regulator transcription factor [Flavivirga rizhaonensis]|uniref:hybrid sensor histidine kinase/response regulator transcription factor n=1 Tax=Flavivirga rizhaonensis TaxID=2559571 RepID=UPI001FE73503|nr:two-component regulator propeller domain-containing protein [Flavivirga rizhaonensis]